MIHANERSRLSEPVSLNNSETEPSPEFFGLAIKGCPAGNKRPELPSKFLMNAAEHPPAAQKVFAFRGGIIVAEFRELPCVVQIAFDFFFERVDHARHRNQHRNPLAPDRTDYVARPQRFLKEDCAPQKRRQVNSKKLAEDMTQRQQV